MIFGYPIRLYSCRRAGDNFYHFVSKRKQQRINFRLYDLYRSWSYKHRKRIHLVINYIIVKLYSLRKRNRERLKQFELLRIKEEL